MKHIFLEGFPKKIKLFYIIIINPFMPSRALNFEPIVFPLYSRFCCCFVLCQCKTRAPRQLSIPLFVFAPEPAVMVVDECDAAVVITIARVFPPTSARLQRASFHFITPKRPTTTTTQTRYMPCKCWPSSSSFSSCWWWWCCVHIYMYSEARACS